MNGSTVTVAIGLVVVGLLTAAALLLLSVPFVDDPPAPTTTHGTAWQPTLLPIALTPADDRAMP